MLKQRQIVALGDLEVDLLTRDDDEIQLPQLSFDLCRLPARRASRVDPVVALRAE